MPDAKNGSWISLRVEILGEDGDLVEQSPPDQPIETELGSGELPAEVEAALVGKAPGDTVEVRTEAGVAFADPDPEAIVSVPRDDLAEHSDELAKGGLITITIEHEDGTTDEIDAAIIEINEDAVILDANHPLAGKVAVFRVTLVDVEDE